MTFKSIPNNKIYNSEIDDSAIADQIEDFFMKKNLMELITWLNTMNWFYQVWKKEFQMRSIE